MQLADFYSNNKDQRESAGQFSNEKINFILEEIGSKKHVLDVGCNDGFIGERIIKNDNIVYGIDLSKSNLSIAKKRGLKVKCLNIEKGKFPFQENFFDAIILGDTIEHIFDTDTLLKQCHKLLKKEGKLIITTPNVASIGRRIMLLLGINPFLEYSVELTTSGVPSVGHIRYYTTENLKNQLIHNGFYVKNIKGEALNLIFFRLKFLGNLFPSFSNLIMGIGIKK